MQTRILCAFSVSMIFACGAPVVIGDERPGDTVTPPPSTAPSTPPPQKPGWSATATLSLGGEDSSFESMALTDTRAAFGAYREGTALGPSVGAAYVFERDGDRWVRGQRLTSPAPQFNEAFGFRLAIHDDLIVVAAGSSPQQKGVVYVFAQRDGFWTHVGTIPSPVGPCSGLVLTADTLAIASADGLSLFARSGESFSYLRTIPGDGNNYPVVAASDGAIAVATDGVGRPTAYVTLSNGGVWSDPISLGPLEDRPVSLAVDGTRVAVGQYGDWKRTPGTITLYELAGGSPVQIGQVVGPSNSPAFGSAVALRGDRVASDGLVMLQSKSWAEEEGLVLAEPDVVADFDVRSHPGSLGGPSSIHLGADEIFYQRNGTVLRAKLGEPDAKAQRRALQRLAPAEMTSNPGIAAFGDAVSVGGDVAIVEGTGRAEAPAVPPSSRWWLGLTKMAYLFERRLGAWQFKQTFSGLGDCAVSVGGETVACRSASGGVQTLARGGDGRWRVDQNLEGGTFVKAMAVDVDRVAVAIHEGTSQSVLVYERTGNAWTLQHRAPVAIASRDEDGFHVLDDILAIGVGPSLVAFAIRPDERGTRSGVYVRGFARSSDGRWADVGDVLVCDLRVPDTRDDVSHVAVSEDRVVVLRHRDAPVEYHATLEEFTRTGSAWAMTASAAVPLSPSGRATSLARADRDWLVGASGDATGSVTNITRTESGFSLGAKWTDDEAVGAAKFGEAVAASRSTRVVGEPGHDRVHVFERTSSKLR